MLIYIRVGEYSLVEGSFCDGEVLVDKKDPIINTCLTRFVELCKTRNYPIEEPITVSVTKKDLSISVLGYKLSELGEETD